MNRYLWVDDLRDPPCGWMWATTYDKAIRMLQMYDYKKISLDHDLGEERTGYDVIKWLEERLHYGDYVPPIIQIHSANPVGRANIKAAIDSMEAFRTRIL